MIIEPQSTNELTIQLNGSGGNFDYLYLSAHGNSVCFASSQDANKCRLMMNWPDLAYIICQSNCLNEDALLLLSCCHSGVTLIASSLFTICPKINYIIGANCNLPPVEMIMGFSIVIFNKEFRRINPDVAISKVFNGADIQFSFYDRQHFER